MRDLAVLLIFILHGAPDDAMPSTTHEIEIKEFASTMAVAQVASDRCADILVNLPMLADYQRRLHVASGDSPVLSAEGRMAMSVFSKAIDEAPSSQAWCDAIYRLYGPNGQMIRGLMSRSPSP